MQEWYVQENIRSSILQSYAQSNIRALCGKKSPSLSEEQTAGGS